jgi:FtsH-binding integral membrane protein
MTEGHQFDQETMRMDSQAAASARATFITRTYTHLFGAIVTFTLLEVYFFSSGIAESIARALLGVNWLFVLGGFVIVSWFATRTAHAAKSPALQYAALGAFVLAEAIIFIPLLYVANYHAPGVISSAATVTLLGFTILTFIAFQTRKNFSFLGGILRWGLGLALVAIVAGVLFGFELGTWFSVAMVGLAGGAILYDTSNIIRVYPTDRHVGAALQLFASVALMFWYVLRIFMSRR